MDKKKILGKWVRFEKIGVSGQYKTLNRKTKREKKINKLPLSIDLLLFELGLFYFQYLGDF